MQPTDEDVWTRHHGLRHDQEVLHQALCPLGTEEAGIIHQAGAECLISLPVVPDLHDQGEDRVRDLVKLQNRYLRPQEPRVRT